MVAVALLLWLVGFEPFRSDAPRPRVLMPGTPAPPASVPSTPTQLAGVPPLADPSVVKPADPLDPDAPGAASPAEPGGETMGLSPQPAPGLSTDARPEAPPAGEDVPLSPDLGAGSTPDAGSGDVDGQAMPAAGPQDVAVGGVVGEFDPFKSPLGQPLIRDPDGDRLAGEVTPFDSPLAQPPGGTEALAAPAAKGDWVWPVRGVISQRYSSAHRAIDIDAAQGSVVGAADAGQVVYARWESSGYGYLVIIDHDNGYVSYYAHLYGFYVDVGQTVARGQQIGELGNTGDSTGPHLHFEIRYGGVQHDPLDLLPGI